eukprot:SAG31_NODE_403_length_16150_cov_12.566588_6_plen_94_part_00
MQQIFGSSARTFMKAATLALIAGRNAARSWMRRNNKTHHVVSVSRADALRSTSTDWALPYSAAVVDAVDARARGASICWRTWSRRLHILSAAV